MASRISDGQVSQNLRLYGGQIPQLVQEIIRELTERALIEVSEESMDEFKIDVQSVLRSYVRMDRRLTEEARETALTNGLDHREHHKIKRRLAEDRHFKLNKEAPGFISEQLIETFMQSRHVDEIFAGDSELRALLVPLVRYHMNSNRDISAEVRKRLRTLDESSREWDVRFQQIHERLSQKYNLHGDA